MIINNMFRIGYWAEESVHKIRYWWWCRSARLKKAYAIYAALYHDVNGARLSLEDPARLGRYGNELVYGEINFYTLAAILEFLTPDPTAVFYDLGSGTGKACIVSALLFPFAKIYGVEFLPSLYQCSLERLQLLNQRADLPRFCKPTQIKFIQDDFFQQDLAQADIVLVNGTCFLGESKTKLITKLLQVKPGCRLISISKELPQKDFDLLDVRQWHMSWGESLIYIFERKAA